MVRAPLIKSVRSAMDVSVDFCTVDIFAMNAVFSSSLFFVVSWIESLKSFRKKAKSWESCEIVSVEAVEQSSLVRSIFSRGEEGGVESSILSIKGVLHALELLSPYTTNALFFAGLLSGGALSFPPRSLFNLLSMCKVVI